MIKKTERAKKKLFKGKLFLRELKLINLSFHSFIIFMEEVILSYFNNFPLFCL